MPPLALVALAGIAILEGVALVAYAMFDVVEAVRVGITGPAEVSNPMALLLLVGITAAFGAGLLVVGRGWWTRRAWARSPFIVAQVIIGLIGYELSQADGSVERAAGLACVLLAGIGLVLSFLPAVGRAVGEGN